MKLTLKEITEIARGVAYVSENDGVFTLHRFTKAQEKTYLAASPDKVGS